MRDKEIKRKIKRREAETERATDNIKPRSNEIKNYFSLFQAASPPAVEAEEEEEEEGKEEEMDEEEEVEGKEKDEEEEAEEEEEKQVDMAAERASGKVCGTSTPPFEC